MMRKFTHEEKFRKKSCQICFSLRKLRILLIRIYLDIFDPALAFPIVLFNFQFLSSSRRTEIQLLIMLLVEGEEKSAKSNESSTTKKNEWKKIMKKVLKCFPIST